MLTGSKVILREKRLADARDDYTWQTDPELAQLDATPLLDTSLIQYLLDYPIKLHYSSLIRCQFAIDTLDGKHIGNCVYYGINETKGEAELGIMIGNRDYWDKGYGSDALVSLLSHIFRETKLNRVYLKTLDSNQRAQKCFQKCGFIPYGYLNKDGYSFVLMEIRRNQWGKKGKWEFKTASASSRQSNQSLT
ncbi:MAG TPA: GNAT family N-acetyltransferase [Dehalococcoidia bacterium]|nr:GNAT family N-acetyltransferase [Dehalococcoidia bacterium]